mmetsp:Transcript_19743/g.42520  ORF Transcript_19743/g.42520 Transcript_19743/m.42520 type:complete len:203 (-) Transcript_19743:241-849(-)
MWRPRVTWAACSTICCLHRSMTRIDYAGSCRGLSQQVSSPSSRLSCVSRVQSVRHGNKRPLERRMRRRSMPSRSASTRAAARLNRRSLRVVRSVRRGAMPSSTRSPSASVARRAPRRLTESARRRPASVSLRWTTRPLSGSNVPCCSAHHKARRTRRTAHDSHSHVGLRGCWTCLSASLVYMFGSQIPPTNDCSIGLHPIPI